MRIYFLLPDLMMFVCFYIGLFSELYLCYCRPTLFVFRAVFSTLGLTVLSYCIFIWIFNFFYHWTNKDGWTLGGGRGLQSNAHDVSWQTVRTFYSARSDSCNHLQMYAIQFRGHHNYKLQTSATFEINFMFLTWFMSFDIIYRKRHDGENGV